ncbi:MAG: type IV secretory system conjugative DNA transfer family protein, partial [Blautia sp.]|nr:type IV secretory system conjugative DNA transfer family protein [Blautia sp.]
MSGIKNIKKKLKGFQVRPPNVEVLKKVLLHIPYVVVFYVVNKCTWLYQYCRGSTVVDRLMVLFMNYPLAFKKLLPSIQPKSLAAGTIAAVSVWAVVYFKGKNGKKFRQGEEYGSARWGNEKDIAPFIDPVFENNILLTQTERLTMNSRPKKPKYARNKNVIVIGGSGSGKTRFYVKPQLMQMPDNVSFVVTDPKGTIIVECGKMLARGTPKKDKNGKILRDKNGRVVMAPYKIKVLNTINFAKSMHYNPFHYIRSEKDILKLVNTIMVNTKGEGEKSSEDFWTKAERLLYCALIGYIYYEAPEEEQNFSTLLEFINASETREEDEEFKNAVDLLFEELERDEPNHFAVRQYKKYKLAAGKTAKSILISCGARLAPFDIAELRELTSYDEMELDMIGDQRTALFIVISDTDDTFNFVVAMMYSQLFNLLCDRADDVHHGRLPYHVRILCDEFANIGQIPKFDKLIATIRSREISASIILQSQSQLKTIYKDAAETITGNCDTMLFLGGKESTTLKEISETLGKETIDLYNTSDTRGQSRSYGLNYQKTGKELMSRDELAVMDGNKCILQLRGVRPFYS